MKPCITALAALIAPLTAAAQERAEDITVTGQRELEETADVAGRLGLTNRETPATVAILTQEDFRREGVRTAIEAMNAAPGVASGNLPGSIGSVSMRGFHRAVNYLYDGIRMANSDVAVRNWDAWAFERIEVIKGPASVTSGEGALAGAINFVPRKARLDGASAEMMAGIGSFETVRLAGDANIPLSPTLAVRGTASWSRSSGWIDDTDSSTLSAIGSLTYEPVERLSLTLSADYFRDDFATAYFGTPAVARGAAIDPSDAVSGSAGLVLDRAMRRVNYDVLDSRMDSTSLWLRGRADYVLTDTLRLVSDTSWYDADRHYGDADEYRYNAATGLIDRSATIITHDHRFWNQRIHLAHDAQLAGMRNRLTIGVEAGGTDFFTERRFGSVASVDPLRPDRGTLPPDTPANYGTRQDVTAKVGSLALFAEDALNLSAKWLVAGGVRIDWVDLDRSVVNATTGTDQRYGQDYAPLSWRIGTVYSVTPRTQLFAQATRAVTPVSGLLFLSAANAAFDLTRGTAQEAGIKTSLTGTGVELTASLFHIRQDGILTRDPADPAVVLQGGRQRSYGVEAALSLPIDREWTLTASGTLLDAAYEQLVESGGADRAGNRPPNVPERIADLVVTWVPAALPVTLTGSVRHQGSFHTEPANVVRVNGFTTVDAALSWRAPFGTAAVRVRNLTDVFHADWSGYASGLVFIGAPRSIDLSVNRAF